MFKWNISTATPTQTVYSNPYITCTMKGTIREVQQKQSLRYKNQTFNFVQQEYKDIFRWLECWPSF